MMLSNNKQTVITFNGLDMSFLTLVFAFNAKQSIFYHFNCFVSLQTQNTIMYMYRTANVK